jgi:hypothetical protein
MPGQKILKVHIMLWISSKNFTSKVPYILTSSNNLWLAVALRIQTYIGLDKIDSGNITEQHIAHAV